MIDLDLRKHWKTIALITAAAALLAVLISVIIGLFRNAATRQAQEGLSPGAATESAAYTPELIDELELRPEKLMLFPNIEQFYRGWYVPRIEPRRQWDMDDFRRYWHNPREIGGESLRDLNAQLIDEILEEYR